MGEREREVASECESFFGGEPMWALQFEKICSDVDKCRARSGRVEKSYYTEGNPNTEADSAGYV